MKKSDDLFTGAEALYRQGFALIWLHPKSKRPIEAGWTTGPRTPWKQLAATYRRGFNVGVRLGTPSKLSGGFLAVMDVDIKSKDPRHRAEAMEALKKLTKGKTFPMVRTGRGLGSCHLYVMTDKPFKCGTPYRSDEKVLAFMPSKKPSKREREELPAETLKAGWRNAVAWEVSLYSDGRQVVLPPSVHPDTGKAYTWKDGLPKKLPVFNVGTALSGVSEDPGDQEVTPPVKKDNVGNRLEGFVVETVDLEWVPDLSPDIIDLIKTGKGSGNDSDFLIKAASALVSAGLTQNEVLSVLTDPRHHLGGTAYVHAHAKKTERRKAAAWLYRYTLQKVIEERTDVSAFKTPVAASEKLTPEEMEAEQAEFDKKHWGKQLDKTNKGAIRPTLKNIDLILTNAVDGNAFEEDLFASQIEYGVDTPWGGKAKTHIRDIDMILVKRWLSGDFGIEPATNSVLEATSLVAHRMRVHPVREWLESLKWDGVPRIDTWIQKYCLGRAEEPFRSEVSRKFLLAMVKRVFEPGCQWDYVLILEGAQGKLKSSIARALASDRWFMDNLPDLRDKDAMLNLQGKWLIELGELAGVKRADYSSVKSYLVRRTDTVRAQYGRLKADVPRQSVFIGTVNEFRYLQDPTGNRRYWPIKVGLCDVKGLLKVRDQLFAEAMHVYRTTNEVLMLSPKADAQATDAQNERRVDDDETEMTDALWVFQNTEIGKEFLSKPFLTNDLTTGVNAPLARWSFSKGGHVAAVAANALTKLGYERKSKSHRDRRWRKIGAVVGRLKRTAPDNSDFF